ncbi:MAG: nucleotide exchange factor GrpE [Nitrospinae bacterium CG11_big_fil_rev_8_21_14_0_20_45_15]|nr:MAG: nucleotide exchange factor GrpE [Nitrospinae bacterium CG11_big_fil_rev_8_21_14_0_20_45_15]
MSKKPTDDLEDFDMKSSDDIENNSLDEETSDLTDDIEVDAVATLQEQLNQKDAQISELESEILRVKADTQNYKKRLDKEKSDMRKYGSERVFKELLTIQDNFERALSVSNVTVETLREGVEMIQKELAKLLDKENVTALTAVGKAFDPTIHEVLSQVESNEHDENTVIQEHIKGYLLHDRILRPAQVIIAKAPAKSEDEESA